METANLETSPVIKIKSLTKMMGKQFSLSIPNLQIGSGRVVGVVGLNGSGKTTLLNIIAGYFLPNTGMSMTLGVESKLLTDKEYARIGIVPQRPDLIPFMIGSDFIEYISTFYEAWDWKLEREVIKLLDVRLDKKLSSMSPGEQQKVALVMAISFRPQLLLLDEPAAELDPIARRELLELLLRLLRESNTTVLISSHVLTDLEKIADSIVLLHEGQVIRDCNMDDFREEKLKVRITASSGNMPKLPERLPAKTIHSDPNATLVLVRKENLVELQEFATVNGCAFDAENLVLEEAFRNAIESARG